MGFEMEGTYLETCSCDTVCPCTWSGLESEATYDRCKALLAFHIDRGEADGVDLNGLSFGLIVDTPPLMSEGNWRVGVYVDAAADGQQTEKLGAVLSGEMGGPPALLQPLIGEMLGVEQVPIQYKEDGRSHRVKIGDSIDIEVTDFVPAGSNTDQPVQLTNVFHPAASTLTVAPTQKADISGFGIEFGRPGESGFSAPFNWTG